MYTKQINHTYLLFNTEEEHGIGENNGTTGEDNGTTGDSEFAYMHNIVVVFNVEIALHNTIYESFSNCLMEPHFLPVIQRFSFLRGNNVLRWICWD